MQSSEFDLSHHDHAIAGTVNEERIDRLNWKLHKIEVTNTTKFT